MRELDKYLLTLGPEDVERRERREVVRCVHAEGIRRFPYIAHILDAAEKVPHQISKHVLVVLPLLHHMAEDILNMRRHLRFRTTT